MKDIEKHLIKKWLIKNGFIFKYFENQKLLFFSKIWRQDKSIQNIYNLQKYFDFLIKFNEPFNNNDSNAIFYNFNIDTSKLTFEQFHTTLTSCDRYKTLINIEDERYRKTLD